MLDLGWQELFLITLVGLLVVGPKQLPGLVRSSTAWIRKTKLSVSNFQSSLEEIAREAELEEVKNQTKKIIFDEVSSLPSDLEENTKPSQCVDGWCLSGVPEENSKDNEKTSTIKPSKSDLKKSNSET